ncbi:MAG: TetR/AcrR family transcriptional regulator [Candidatus Binataceae bacterium]
MKATNVPNGNRGKAKRGRPHIPLLRQRILRCAAEMFSDKAFDQVLTNDLAARAGVGKGSIYRVFGSKEELYVATIIEGFVQLRDQIDEALARVATPREQVETIVGRTLRYFWDRGQFFIFLHSDNLSRRHAQHYREERERFSRLIVAVLERGMKTGAFRADLDVDLAAQALLGILRGLSRYRREHVTPDHAVRVAAATFLDGFSARAPASPVNAGGTARFKRAPLAPNR